MRLMLSTMLVLVTAAGCSSDATSKSTVTYDGLRNSTSTACPVDLDGALKRADLDAGTTTATGRSEHVDPTPERAEAVLVTCTADLGAGRSIRLRLYAARDRNAGLILLPQLQVDAELGSTTLQQVADEIDKGDIGKPVALPDVVDDVSFMPTKVSGATSAVVLLKGSGGVDRAALDRVAIALDEAVH